MNISTVTKIVNNLNLWKNVIPVQVNETPIRRSYCRNGHEYTKENTLNSHKKNRGHRRCLICTTEARAQALENKRINEIERLKKRLESLSK